MQKVRGTLPTSFVNRGEWKNIFAKELQGYIEFLQNLDLEKELQGYIEYLQNIHL